MRDKIGDLARLLHIRDSITELEEFLSEKDHKNFLQNRMLQAACIRQLEIIGEATNHISKEIKQNFSDIEWREITSLRNLLIHEYFGIDLNIVWEIISTDIPKLKMQIVKIIQKLQY